MFRVEIRLPGNKVLQSAIIPAPVLNGLKNLASDATPVERKIYRRLVYTGVAGVGFYAAIKGIDWAVPSSSSNSGSTIEHYRTYNQYPDGSYTLKEKTVVKPVEVTSQSKFTKR